jgi:peptide/nickel transport system substrate-binding protein
MIKRVMLAAALLMMAAGLFPTQAETTLRIGLNSDPDMLDPSLARTFTSRTVFAALCDKLVDISPELDIVPQLATEWHWTDDGKGLVMRLRPGVRFHDGEPFNAAAVKYSLKRHQTLPGSTRRSEINSIKDVEIIDDLTVKLVLWQPSSPLLSLLADRAGMIVSPKAAEVEGDKFADHPVCAGPYKFVERVPQDRIVVERFPDYWNKDAIKFDKIIYLPVPDSTVRLANLLSGGLDMIETVAAADFDRLGTDSRVKLYQITGLGYEGVRFNTNHGELAKKPLGSDPRLREAFELAIDREALNQVVFNGHVVPGNQFMPPNSPFYAKEFPIPPRNVEKAKQLLAAAGQPHPIVTMLVQNLSELMQAAQVLQAMVGEAGFDLKLQTVESNTAINMAHDGQYESYLSGWSGRLDPDGNIYNFAACKAPLNDAGYCNPTVDRELDEARIYQTPAERLPHYAKVIAELIKDRPMIFLWHVTWLWAATPKLAGFTPYPDGLIRPQGLRMQ